MIIGGFTVPNTDVPAIRCRVEENDLALRDTFRKDNSTCQSFTINESKLQQLFRPDASSINTDWGYGKNENSYNSAILKACRDKWGDYEPSLPPILVKATIAKESAFKADAVSPAGYVGLMQLGKNEAASQGLSLSPVDERYVPEKNINAGIGTLKTKHKVISKPLDFYPNEAFAKNVDKYLSEKGALSTNQKWYMTLAAYNGGGGTVMRAMDYAIQSGRDPREWNNLLEPKDSPEKSALYKGITDVYGDKFALSKYYEMGKYPTWIMQRAGMIGMAEAETNRLDPADYETGDDTVIQQPDQNELIEKVNSMELKSDKDLDDPLPAIRRQGTSAVVDESIDSDKMPPEGQERTYRHKRVEGGLFDASGNWLDTKTAVAADQLAGLSDSQKAEFIKATGAKNEEITKGDASVMLRPSSEDWDHMQAPKPAITYKKIDYSKIGDVEIQPKYLVMHYTGGEKDSANGVWNWFDQKKGKPSTQFIVARDGGILQTMPENQKCHGTNYFNDESIQIEVCGNFRLGKETDEEFQSTVALVKYLQKKYNIPDTNIISHRQVDNNCGQPGRKPDPGFRFMNRLYDELK
ncbi:MAG: N-acetylmuramoyl-L-alanine amidase [Firmicutes bacterium]|nr:N-acetylmuramoyl-L-alanine amidase [Bacillota bacterium]